MKLASLFALLALVLTTFDAAAAARINVQLCFDETLEPLSGDFQKIFEAGVLYSNRKFKPRPDLGVSLTTYESDDVFDDFTLGAYYIQTGSKHYKALKKVFKGYFRFVSVITYDETIYPDQNVYQVIPTGKQ